ncbi:MAG: class I SAM-dependent methyltransferase [Ignavibacteria bacterium]|jgi:ubiquinone/menaquinone biosynthesis C-methylase UbiE
MYDITGFEQVNCLLCGSSCYKVLLKHNTNVVKCLDCGFVYSNPRIKEEYNRQNISGQGDFDIVRYNALRDHEIPRFNEQLKKIEKIKDHGKILDIGCGNGNFLECAKHRGWETYGVDINPSSLKPCSKFGSIYIGTVHEAKYQDDFFDVIFSSSTFYYLTDPLVFLKETTRILKPGGLIFITGILNIKSLAARINIERYIRPYPPEQVSFYFDKKHLKILMNRSGLKKITLRTSGLGSGRVKLSVKGNNEESNVRKENVRSAVQKDSLNRNIFKRMARSVVNGFLDFFGLGYHITMYASKEK